MSIIGTIDNNVNRKTQMIQLRPYQWQFVDDINAAWSNGARSVLGVMPTGGGKTVCFAWLMHEHLGASAAIVHRKEIVSQISCALAQLDVKHRVIAPPPVVALIRRKHLKLHGRSYVDPHARAGVISVQTLTSKASERNREIQKWTKQISMAVFDECFPAGTLVDDTRIEDIRVGDYVTSFNERTGGFERRSVTHTFKNNAPDTMVRVCFGRGRSLICTEGHPFWTQRGWVAAGGLDNDDKLLDLRGSRCADKTARKSTLPKNRSGVLQYKVQQHCKRHRSPSGAAARKSGTEERYKCAKCRCDTGPVARWRRVKRVDTVAGGGYVYNLAVDGLHTYTADGVVVHNCHHYARSGFWSRAVDALTA